MLLACGADGACLVKNDGALDDAGGALQGAALATSLVHLASGAASAVASQAVSLPRGAGSAAWLCVNASEGPPPACAGYVASLAAAGCAADGSDCMLALTLAAAGGAGAVLAQSHELLAAPARLALAPARVAVAAVEAANATTATVALTTDAPALFVTLTTQAPGRFSSNALTLLLPPGRNLTFEFWRSADDLALLASTLRVEHAQMYR